MQPNRGKFHIDHDELFRRIVRGHISLISIVEALTVSEHRSFRKSSQILKVSQSSISNRIAALETSIGFPIFDRLEKISVTHKGRHFLSLAGEALNIIGEALRPIKADSQSDNNQLIIGVQSCNAGGFLNEFLCSFSNAHPDVKIISAEFSPDSLPSSLRRREIDVAFSPEVPTPRVLARDILRTKPLWKELMVVALSMDDPLSHRTAVDWAALAKHTFLVRRDGMGPWLMAQAILHFEDKGIVPQIERLRIGRDTMLADVARRRAAAFTSEASTVLNIPGVCMRPIKGEPVVLNFHAIWSRQNHNPALRSFLETIETVKPAVLLAPPNKNDI